jgi:ribosomal protein S18 acetylase RimI-like enzyme
MKLIETIKLNNIIFKTYKINKHEVYIFKKLHLEILKDTPKQFDSPYDYKELKKDFDNKSAIFLTFNKNKPIAYSFVYCFKENNKFKKNFKKYCKISTKDIELTAEFAGAGVLKKYRGNALQDYLIKLREKYLKNINYKYSVISAHPDNIYSKKNVLKNNYKLISTGNKDGNLRLYFKKEI